MAYVETDNMIEDIMQRKEFNWLQHWKNDSNKLLDKEVIPRFLLDDAIKNSMNLKLASYQLFVQNFINPSTPYKRLLMQWATGTGKTIGMLSIAMNFINRYRLEQESGNSEIGTVFIIGFSKRVFMNELLKFQEFGFLNKSEKLKMQHLKKLAMNGVPHDIIAYKEFVNRIKKRFTNRKINGFFKFFGYKEFVNRIFISDKGVDINELSEDKIKTAIEEGHIKFDKELIVQFKNSLILCDEIHNVYNSLEKNNWGIAIQSVLNMEETCRAVFASATPLSNSPSEIIDLLNLLSTDKTALKRSDFFTQNLALKDGAIEKIASHAYGKVSYLQDTNPMYYPSVINEGEIIRGIDYLKFIRCPMSDYHYKTYKDFYKGVIPQDGQYLVDFVIENPNGTDGLFKSGDIKSIIPYATKKFKDDYGFDFENERIIGPALKRENLIKYSSKFVSLLDHILLAVKNNLGKIMIYHNYVHMSGILFIEQVLLNNGFLDEFSPPSNDSICFYCGKPKKVHEGKTGGNPNEKIEENASMCVSLHRKKNKFIWEDTMDIQVKEKPKQNTFIILSNSLSKDVILVDYNKIITMVQVFKYLAGLQNKTSMFIFQVPHVAVKLHEFLKTIGFKIKESNDKFVIMEKRWNNEENLQVMKTDVIGGKETDVIGSKETDGVIGGKEANITSSEYKHQSIHNHKFTPVRYIIAHNEIQKTQLEHSIDKFNSDENSDGSRIMILLGSNIIKESLDMKAIRNVFIAGRPDNISSFIQIRGRAVRKNSHKSLPQNKRNVRVLIFTTSLPTKKDGQYIMSYEEEKYAEKIRLYKIMQTIEKTLHENSIDRYTNYKVNSISTGDPLEPLSYKIPKDHFSKELSLSQLNLSTFSVYNAKKEVDEIKMLIKRLFIEISSVWEYNDLLYSVRNPLNYETELNTKLFSEDNFLIAIDQLVWNNPDPQYYENREYITPFINKQEITDINKDNNLDTSIYLGHSIKINNGVIERLYDSLDKIITLPSGGDNVIVPILNNNKQYYILFLFNKELDKPEIDIESPYRIDRLETGQVINLNYFITHHKEDFDYEDKRLLFYNKFADVSIENMENVICEYGTNFHLKFIEECIEYVFKVWTDANITKSKYHEFYFKMLYYYDLLSLVMFAYTTKPKIFKEYSSYAIPVYNKDIKLKTLEVYEKRGEDKNDDAIASSGIINLLKTTINRTSNNWIPQEFREEYEKTIKRSLDLFQGHKKKSSHITKVSAMLLPIGHYVSQFPKLYIPNKGFIEDPSYSQNDQNYIENNIIVGYDERSKTGVHIRFKLRKPIHNIKKFNDARLIERGIVCKSRSKEELYDIIKKLDIELNEDTKKNIIEMCNVIRSKLIRLELKERIKGSKIKYFYFHYEKQIQE
jgi:hypothetical protein